MATGTATATSRRNRPSCGRRPPCRPSSPRACPRRRVDGEPEAQLGQRLRRIAMSSTSQPIRVLQSFPHKIGAARICTTAWHQAAGAAEAGADVLVMPGAVHRPLPEDVARAPDARARQGADPVQAARPRARAAPARPARRARAAAARGPDRRRAHLAAGRARDAAHRPPARHPDRARAPERPHPLRLRGRARRSASGSACRCPPTTSTRTTPRSSRSRRRSTRSPTACCARRSSCVRTFLDQGFAAERLVRHQYGYDDARFHPAPTARDRRETA